VSAREARLPAQPLSLFRDRELVLILVVMFRGLCQRGDEGLVGPRGSSRAEDGAGGQETQDGLGVMGMCEWACSCGSRVVHGICVVLRSRSSACVVA
jgi:hypothetical protein